MQATNLPNDAKAGPTKPEVRAVLARKLALGRDDHFVEVGSCTGAVTIEAARRAGRVTALERKSERLEATRANLDANEYGADVRLVNAEAPERLPDDGDVVFLGGSRNYERVLDDAVAAGYDRIVMNVSRLEVAGEAARAFRDRDLLDEVLCLQMATGYDLAGATSFDADNPVYMLVGEPGSSEEPGPSEKPGDSE
ncbi:precorrin-6Y C5,15-methyltransferase (decarboxylating) subunit CbiT [Halorubrum ezzemoulense]|uniref:Precorrin-6Y C5,15-methyltransferase (Decarboxylating) subunit CbiT n=1 Tax=Halorubrum ezzemoulense TaxID=337243 RepID=A0A256J5R8_HALEZ|nr:MULTISPECIES: precorrin-6Y C5,15-methyltransferase (decarboxylating) subunit CbiT [Halorubrum]MDB2249318.1 precorrin-6Y C5,15-methyltransferase (decarboxylating) subunit CbiT [Halorubrum ezzemoulense]MDB2283326.1 precorrin-6Y C5,15-methyltransferase (decarboxylating) subunit CbiT [Halorubrum ezzemoulense]OYR64160.1 precorrin-6Y C5,15-methyltransferase (decarboxylating) subunit CbiT [Halorubrum ezzemoulense]TKX37480.1 precorrin-6Y C5,15-methyltransferase (decarboxylating) subunit CbiT [Haloru